MTCTGPGSDSKKAAAGRGGMPVLEIVGGLDAEPTPPVPSTNPLTLLAPVLLTVLLAPGLVTTPEPVEFVMVPVLVPTKAPTVLLAPVLVTAPEAVEFVMVPALAPTKPPPTLAAPMVTLPLACEPVITPLTELEATSPPAVLASPACTVPRATDDRIIPELLPTKPPA